MTNNKLPRKRRNRQTLKVMLAVLLPPLAVFLATGASRKLLVNFALTLCFWIPGVIHAVFVLVETFKPVRDVKFVGQYESELERRAV